VPKLVPPVAVRPAPRHALAVAALVPVVLLATPARAQEGGGVLGLLSRLMPHLPAAARPAPVPAPPPAPALVILSPPALADIARPIPAAALPGPPPVPLRQALPRGEPGRRDASLRREARTLRVRPAAIRAASAPPVPARAKDPGRVENPVPGLLGDRTLRSGDLAMFPDSLRVFTGRSGRSHGLGDFAPLARAGAALPASLRRLAAGLQPGWNRAWSTAGLAAGTRPDPGGVERAAADAPAARSPGGPVVDAPRPAPERPAGDAVRLAAIAPAVTVQEAPRAPAASGPPPRLKGCPGGARAGEDPHWREAFACTPDPEEATRPDTIAPVRLAQHMGANGD
jgi:hypothetical protein